MTEIKEKKCLVKKVIAGARGQMKRVFPILQKYKKGIVGIVGILVFILLCAYCVNGRSSVGFVDVLQVREKASVYQGILANQQKYEEEWRNRFNAEKELLVKEDKALADKRSKTKVSTFKKKVDSFQKKSDCLSTKISDAIHTNYDGDASGCATGRSIGVRNNATIGTRKRGGYNCAKAIGFICGRSGGFNGRFYSRV